MNECLSCDTIVALGNCTESGNVIFAKNSDRPLGEAQPLCLFEARDYPDQELLPCTYISIPQASHTYKVLGSKPYWIWGFEHGMNEWGVAIGNEAVWSREEEERENGLLGMDLVRLGLERAKTAHEALHVITDLLKTYGQGGNASVTMDFRYHNSFLIADTCEAWILDTVNRRWVARRVKNAEGISNCYGTGQHWDEDSGDIQEHAYEMGYADRGQIFDFARAYGAVNFKLRAAYPRYKRLNQLLDRRKGALTPDYMRDILKDHFEGEIIAPRWSPTDGILASVCMHNMDESSSKTVAGSVVELSRDKMPVWWSCMSNPCISVFLPFIMETAIPQKVSCGGAMYSEDSLWWKLERLSYELEEDYPRNTALWNPVKEALQEYVCSRAEKGLDGALLREMVSKLEEKADEMYLLLRDTNVSGSQPQRKEVLRTARSRAGIL
ncbi:MAG: C69 family dipeptidase [Clostridia bacterium]|nr:C69 family dipeptidase [Clostridia bacterium]